MLAKDFYRMAEERLTAELQARGWARAERGSYAKSDADGFEKLSLDPSKSFERFSVLMSFEPSDMSAFVRDVIHGPDYDATKSGFLCGPYLNQALVGRRRSEWPCKTKEQLLNALERVARAVETVGEPWLRSLRDARTLAEQADPTSALLAGFAWDRAGEHEKAEERYAEMRRRLDESIARYPRFQFPESHMKEYLFLAARLGFQNEHTVAYGLALATWTPVAHPFAVEP
ncbi:MAG: hypothetical protein V4858_24415 [Pseudomonadota bacterium]